MLDLFYKSVKGNALYRSVFKLSQALFLPYTFSYHTVRIPGYPGGDATNPSTPRTVVTEKKTSLFSRYDKVSKYKDTHGLGKVEAIFEEQLLEGMRLCVKGEEWKR